MPGIDGKAAYEITGSTADESCRGFDNDHSGWLLTPGVEGLGRLAAMPQSPFGRMVVTTNFDPLIGASIAAHGGSSFRSFLYRDGSLNQIDGPGTHVVHLHGYWYGSDTLHTPQQLLQERPQLRASLAHLLRDHIVVVMAYGGWDDAFTQAMMSVVLEDSSFPEIIWCFYNDKPTLTPEFDAMLRPGIARGRVTLYSGVNAHSFLPKLADAWGAPVMPALVTDPGDDDLAGEQESDETTPEDRLTNQEKTAAARGYTGPLVEKIIREDSPPVVEFLVGRDDDVEVLRNSDFRVAFVTGFGGQGKSALVAQYFADDIATKGFALRIWRDCRERGARFEDQIIAIIEALGAGKAMGAELAKQPMEDLAELFVQLTVDAPVLIIFDNVDHYVDLERLQLIGSAGEFIDRLLTLDTSSRLILTCRPPIRGNAAPMLTHHLEGLDLDAAKQLFALRRAGSSADAIARAHVATKGHAFWLDLLAAQVAKRSPVVELDELLQSISEGTGEIPDATLRSIWNSLRPREQVTLQALAEGMRPATLLELADYVRREINYNAVTKAINLLRDLNLVVLKARVGQLDTFELHPLIRTFIQKTFPRQERVPYILAILQTYVAWLAPFLSELGSGNAPEAVARSLEAAELCINAERTEEALERLRTVCKTVRWREPPGEFVRIAQRLFSQADLATLKKHQDFDHVYGNYVELLANLGQIATAAEALADYEETLEGKDARYIHYCDLQCYLHWMNGEFPIAIKWGVEGEKLKESGVDTSYSSAHHLALAQRDSGAIDPALQYFLKGLSIEQVIDPAHADVDLGGSYYGNVGRCLHLMGQTDTALACYRKSASLIEDEKSAFFENQAYIRQWVGELLLTGGHTKLARQYFEAAIVKWSVVSPPKAANLRDYVTATFGAETKPVDAKAAEASFLAWMVAEREHLVEQVDIV